MNHQRRTYLSVLAALPLFNLGCLLPFGPVDVQMEVSRKAGVRLKPELALTTDGLTLAALSKLAPVHVPAGHIAWFSFGMYTVGDTKATHDGPLIGHLDLPGWERMARICEGGNETLVYVQAGDRPLRAMTVLVREDDELIIAKMIGRIDRLMEDTVGPGGWGALPMAMFGTGQPAAETGRKDAGQSQEPAIRLVHDQGRSANPEVPPGGQGPSAQSLVFAEVEP